ncbi:MAG: AraC family transcriptional regulator [Bacteroidota bacterium]
MNANTYSIPASGWGWVFDHTFSIAKEDSFMQRVFQIIKENLADENFFLNDLCRALHLERTQLYRKVKASTGKGPSELIREARLEKARNLLVQTEWSISEIAFQTGFKENSHFTKAYRTHFGKTPTEVRKGIN